MRRLLQWITGVAFFLIGGKVMYDTIRNTYGIEWYWLILTFIVGLLCAYDGIGKINKSVEK